MSVIDYQRVVRAMNGTLVSLTAKRAKEKGGVSPGMVLSVDVDGETIDLEDNISSVIDRLAAELEDA